MYAKIKKIFLGLGLLAIIAMLVVFPAKYSKISIDAILVWANVLLPTLFPFFFFTRLVSFLDLTNGISKLFDPATKKLYRVNGYSGYNFFISILSGYPVGSKLTSELYESGLINQNESKTITSFTSNSGPMFILGSVGIGMLFNKTSGYVILISHIIGAIINGLLYRGKKDNDLRISYKILSTTQKDILSDTITSSIKSILIVGGYVVICFVVANICIDLNLFKPISVLLYKLFGIKENITNSFLTGIIEMTTGCKGIASSNMSLQLKTIICTSLISFGGVSTLLQAMSFLKKTGITYKYFTLQKITHCIFSTLVSILLCLLVKL